MTRPSKALVRRRIEDLYRIMLDGALWVDVREFVREKQGEEGSAWFLAEGKNPLSESQIRRYQQRADQLISESCERSRKKLLRRHLAQRRNLFAKANLAGDVRSALACLRDEAELLNLYPSAKRDERDQGGEEVRKLAEAMTARLEKQTAQGAAPSSEPVDNSQKTP